MWLFVSDGVSKLFQVTIRWNNTGGAALSAQLQSFKLDGPPLVCIISGQPATAFKDPEMRDFVSLSLLLL